MSAIDAEPKPRPGAIASAPLRFAGDNLHPLPSPNPLPRALFSDVIEARCSSIGGNVSDQQLGDLLFHLTRRLRGGMGRFGQEWEGRVSPSAGGLHVISLLCIPMNGTAHVGLYDRDRHGIQTIEQPDELRLANMASVHLLTGAKSGTTLQLLADAGRFNSCYDNGASLLWRDSGALAATISLLATSLGLTSVVLGRTGADVLRLKALSDWQPLGAVHLGSTV